ncbi:ABC transporter permease [Stomatobaculum longum]|jgi:putative oligopeptide ABC transporter, permease protein oppC|uniref:ABC transporter permease n=1 Tax=Stomatobaculum longum TaxID=796942 RepID=UPI001CB29875|nr:ABC transporter permease [Stomatobaculum longum]
MDSKWEVLEQSNEAREKIWGRNRSFAGDVWFRFHRKPTAIAGFVIIMLLMLFAFLGPLFTGRSYSEQNLGLVNVSPMMRVFETPDQSGYLYITQNLKLLSVNKDGSLGEQLGKLREDSARQMSIYNCGGAEIALYYGKTPYLVIDPDTLVIAKARTLWNRSYLFGTDALGRDILTRLMYGTRVSLLVAFVAAGVNLILGIVYGGISGYFGGQVDMAMMRVVDIISTIPLTLYVILIMVLMGAGLQSIMVALGTTYWVDMARVVRGQVLSLKQQEFVLAAKTIGSSAKTILLAHLIPNAMGSILVTVTMLIPSAIFMEAFLGFLGIGLQPPLASLGTMCNDATENLRTCPYQLFIPALVIVLIMFAFNFVGDGLRDALDPKLRK